MRLNVSAPWFLTLEKDNITTIVQFLDRWLSLNVVIHEVELVCPLVRQQLVSGQGRTISMYQTVRFDEEISNSLVLSFQQLKNLMHLTSVIPCSPFTMVRYEPGIYVSKLRWQLPGQLSITWGDELQTSSLRIMRF